jgi:hypothetical protein
MFRHLGFAISALVLAAMALATPAARAAYPGQNGKFVWQNSRGLVVVDRNGDTQISSGGVIGPIGAQMYRSDSWPVFSPDGAWVAFQRREWKDPLAPGTATPDPGLFVVRADGTDLRKVYEFDGGGAPETRPTWSHDGSKIAFSYDGDVIIVNATGAANPRTVDVAGARISRPAWSPVADVFAVEYVRIDWTMGIGLLSAPEGGPPTLTSLISRSTKVFGSYLEPSWSPDGEKIAFTHGELNVAAGVGTARVDTINRDGTGHRAVFDFPGGYAEHPLWSPAGDWIVWKLSGGHSAGWEGAHPDGSARSMIAIEGIDTDWAACFRDCAGLLPIEADRDGDGVPDSSDSCPAQAGTASNNGCPVTAPPADGDGDGVPNATDSCPTQAGPASNNGCPVTTPPADGDGDGVPNATDSCPTQAGPASNSGCPRPVAPADRDRDGVADAADACPDVAAPGLPYGCPTAEPDTSGPDIVLPDSDRRIVATRSGVVRFAIGPTSEPAIGLLSLKTAGRVRVSNDARPKLIALGVRSFVAVAGQTMSANIQLAKPARGLLRKAGRIQARATVTLRDANGNATTRRYTFTIMAPRS